MIISLYSLLLTGLLTTGNTMSWTSSNTWLINTGSDYSNLMNPQMNPAFVANCEEMYHKLTGYGWSHNATCAVMGNACYESSINPGMYERGSGRPYYQSGYGLIQWTNTDAHSEADNPLVKWINDTYHDNNWQDGDRQCVFINGDDGANWITKPSWNMTYSEFKTSNASLSYLTRAYFEDRERGTWSTLRQTYAQKISDYFQNVSGYYISIEIEGNGEADSSVNERVQPYAEQGDMVTIWANPHGDDTFIEWVVHNYDVVLLEPLTNATNRFVMPAHNVRFTARFTGETPTPPTPPTPPIVSTNKKYKMPIWMYPMFRV